MAVGLTPTPKNAILSLLSRDDSALLRPHLDAVDLPLRFSLEEPDKPIKYVYFPETGIASVVARGRRNLEIEAGLIGREGMTGIPLLLGDDRSPNATFIQVAGHGLRIKVSDFRAALNESATLHNAMLRFVQTFMIQTSHTALANGRATVEERLSRWILMAHDRLGSEALPLTHEFLALMLGVRRAGVTIALNALEQRALIGIKRGAVVVADRKGLEDVAKGLYGIPEREYQRLFGKAGK